VDLVLVRHGAQDRQGPQCGCGKLSGHGEYQVSILGDALHRRGVRPTCFLTSRSSHAVQTAERLRDRLCDGDARIVPLDALTPGSGGMNALDQLIDETTNHHVDLGATACVCVVGHEGHLSDLVTELTGSRTRPFLSGEAMQVHATDLVELLKGHGQVQSRYPVLDHQEDALREKLQSKMAVATFLAGFVFTALSAVLVLSERPWPRHRVVATVALTGSIALLVASVYVYDQLSTPVGFWTDARAPWLWRRLYRRRERNQERRWQELHDRHGAAVAERDSAPMRLDGPTYRIMVATSRWVYNPAVVLALVGLVALLWGTDDRSILMLGSLGILVAAAYAAWRRPDIGAD
jgi:phosphohistidine phosphatase SixA